MTSISLTQIARILELNIRRVRHVVDRHALPVCSWFDVNLYKDECQRGSPRMVNLTSATMIGVATMMLNSGLKSERIAEILQKAIEVPTTERNQLNLPMLAYAFGNADAYILISERDFVRCVVDGMDSGWVDPDNNFEKLSEYTPLLTTTIHLGRVRDMLTNESLERE